jgi:tetratricopeptide (TPR) repeat protein
MLARERPGRAGAPILARRHDRERPAETPVADGAFPMPSFTRLSAIAAACLLAWAAVPAADLAEARALAAKGRDADARAILDELARTDPASAEVRFELGQLAMAARQPGEAARHFEAAVERDGTKAAYFLALGEAYGSLAQEASILRQPGLAVNCRRAFEKAVELEPGNTEAVGALFAYYMAAPGLLGGGTDKALALAEAFRARDSAAGAVMVCQVHRKEERWDEAETAARAALKERPDDPGALVALGQIFVEAGRFEAAFEHFGALVLREPERLLWKMQHARVAALSGQRLDEAAASLGEAVETAEAEGMAPRHAAWWRLGTVQERRGDLAAARLAYEKALALEPGFMPAAKSLEDLGKSPKGRRKGKAAP